MSSAGPLSGKRALVTGAASGIGRASLEALAAAGSRVVGLDRQPPTGGPRPFVQADLTSEAEIVRGVGEAVRLLGGGLDILVNNAGIGRPTPLASVTAEDIDAVFAVNLRAPILVAREALKSMGEGSRIINLASELARLGRAGSSVYVATKAGMIGLTRSWARELAPGILVNAVAPGPTDTPLLDLANLDAAELALETAHPLGRVGKPEEIAAAIVFLAGPGASFITGHCLGVDGGAAMT